jgi:cation:H+ antiporter
MPYLTILFWFAIMAFSLFILLKSADYFTGIAEILGKTLKIPAFIIGATVVAFGTSLPELAVSIAAIFNTGGDIVAGTVIGSNISNIFLVAGIAIFMSGFVVDFKKHTIEFILLIISTFAIAFIMWDKSVSLLEGVFLLVLLFVYLIYIILSPREDDETEHSKLKWTTYVLFILSIGGIWLGAKYTTRAIEEISAILGVGNNLIAQTVLALGTSLPELAVTIASAKKKQYEIILGNVIGSNIFNALSVIGIPAVVASLR